MEPRLLLHIGANKTGSSAIQSFLGKNAHTLRKIGYLVPDRELGVSPTRVTGEHVFAFQELFNQSNRVGLEGKLRALMKAGGRAVVISAENLSNESNFRLFNKMLPDVERKVILYIRRQDELLTSSWQQWYSKTEPDINSWLILALQQFGHWMRCIEGWEQAVGAGNVIVRIFQRADLINADVVDDFLHTVGIEEPDTPFVRSSELVNPSYSDVITKLVSGSSVLFANAHDNDFYKMVSHLTGDKYVTQKRKVSLISPQQRDKLVEFYRPQNEALCRRYFPNRPRLFDAVDHSMYHYISSEELNRKQLEFLAALVFALYKRTN
jgi:hypothetical protein